MKKIFQFSLLLSALAVIVFFKTMLFSELAIAKLAAILMVVFFTIGMGALDALKRYRYTACIIVAVMAGMLYPQLFCIYFINQGKVWFLNFIFEET